MLYSIIDFSTADIQNRIYEAGLLKAGETAIIIVDHCVLLEYFTGKSYSYRVVNIYDLTSKYIFSRQVPISRDKYNQAVEKILQSSVNYLPEGVEPISKNERAKHLLFYIFTNILPQHGMTFRDKQYELSMEILHGLQNSRLMLCEAEVGTGKTHAYILAVTVHNLFTNTKMPTIISTSTIALQKAMTEEYIPQISDILVEHKIIDRPLSFVVRKGKSHYVCDNRLKTYRSSIQNNKRSEEQGLLNTLFDISLNPNIDLDSRPLTPYVKKRICVIDCSEKCAHSGICRFMSFTKMCLTVPWDFQIANHNFVLADTLRRKNGGKKLLPDAGVRIFDEAHKILDAARQMYGVAFSEELIPDLIHYALPNEKSSGYKMAEVLQLSLDLTRYNGDLFLELKSKENKDTSGRAVHFTEKTIYYVNALISRLKQLTGLVHTTDITVKKKYKSIQHRCGHIIETLQILLKHDRHICWLEKADNGSYILCAIPKALNKQLYMDVWHMARPFILTSGTMSVSGNFSHFKSQNGIDFANDIRVFETSKPSPFDYGHNALLYIPNHMPFPNNQDKRYLLAITEQILRLILKTHGHTMILFTSYHLMERIYYEIQKFDLPFPLFIMNRGRLDAISAFRKSVNGVLFASDSAGEGIDLPGDILSSLIVVRLPFPVPGPIAEYERSLYVDMNNYLHGVIVPSMLIKLRQWFGRGIRCESDTAVFAILDSRAGSHGKYREDVLSALPPIPVTDDMDEVERFIRDKKNNHYFL